MPRTWPRSAEAVGRGLGATACRLTVCGPGCGTGSTSGPRPEHSGGAGRRGPGAARRRAGREIAVDQGAVAGLHGAAPAPAGGRGGQPGGAVFQASRLGDRAGAPAAGRAVHAGGIAVSRWAVVAEMDDGGASSGTCTTGPSTTWCRCDSTLGPGRTPGVDGPAGPRPIAADPDRRPDRGGRGDPGRDGEGGLLAAAGRAGPGPGAAPGLRGGQPPVPVDAAGVDQEQGIPADVEAAVYFCCLEAVNNARKHAPGAAIEVRLETVEGRLRFTVRDEGPGWDTTVKNASRGARAAQRGGPGGRGGRSGGDPFQARGRHHRGGLGPAAGPGVRTVRGGRRWLRLPARGGGVDDPLGVPDRPGPGRDARGPRALPRQRPGRGVARARRAPRRTPAGRRGRSAGCRQHHPGRGASAPWRPTGSRPARTTRRCG